jgi:hypothetical protein
MQDKISLPIYRHKKVETSAKTKQGQEREQKCLRQKILKYQLPLQETKEAANESTFFLTETDKFVRDLTTVRLP